MLPGFVATMRALTTADGCSHSRIAPVGSLRKSRMPVLRPGFFLSPDSHNWNDSKGLHPGHQQFSLLVSSELLTFPPPTTASPFRHDRFVTLLHRRGLPRLSPWQTSSVGGIAVARSRVRSFLGGSPTGLAESSSLALRTGHSPQVTPHPPSRERSYHCRIQAGNVSLIRTYTLLFKRLRRRTRSVSPRLTPAASAARPPSLGETRLRGSPPRHTVPFLIITASESPILRDTFFLRGRSLRRHQTPTGANPTPTHARETCRRPFLQERFQ